MTARAHVLVVAEQRPRRLERATLKPVAAALHCGAEVHVLVAGANAGGAAIETIAAVADSGLCSSGGSGIEKGA